MKHAERPESVSQEIQDMLLSAIKERMGEDVIITEWVGCTGHGGLQDEWHIEAQGNDYLGRCLYEVVNGELKAVYGRVGSYKPIDWEDYIAFMNSTIDSKTKGNL